MSRPRGIGVRRQRGVALLTALLVVALATVAAVAMSRQQALDMRRTGNLLHSEQALAYALGAESWARVVLARDGKDNQVDHLGEDWATQVPVSLVEGGSVQGRVIDLQGRFNLNSLVVDGAPDEAAITRYKRLLRTLQLDEGLADALVDWLDPDLDTRFPDGAEDDVYQRMTPPYRAANGPLADISELRLVRGYTPEVLDKLFGGGRRTPLVCALPEATPLNVNTASAEVLTTLAADMTLADGEALVAARGDQGFADKEELMKQPALAGRQVDEAAVAVASRWFMVVSEARVGMGRVRLASTLQRGDSGTRVVARRRVFVDPVQAPVTEAAEASAGQS